MTTIFSTIATPLWLFHKRGMGSTRTYSLLCPIARALDAVGDRWSLLILRDLHAGPARYSDLKGALPGIAANLLSSRLSDLAEAGLIAREGPERGARYRLTELGQRTRPVLFELAQLGAGLPAPETTVEPGNRRHVAVTLAAACEREARAGLSLRVEIVLDGEPFSFVLNGGHTAMEAGAMLEPPLRYTGSYAALGPIVAGALSFAEHLETGAGQLDSLDGSDPTPFSTLMESALAAIGGRSQP